jgi:hypothetical protein
VEDGQLGATLRGCKEPLRTDIAMVAQYFREVGLLLDLGMIPARAVLLYLGNSAGWFWDWLRPIVAAERDRRGDPEYLLHFERLAAMSRRGAERDRLLGGVRPAGGWQ